MNENQVAPKKPFDKKILIIGAVVLVVLIALVIILVKPGNGGTTGGGTGGGGTVNPAEQKIELTGKNIGNGKVLAIAKSTKTKPHDVDFVISFYDENNEFIRSFDGKINAVPANGTGYYTVDTAGLVKGKYTFNFEIKEQKELAADKVYSDKFTATATKKETELEVVFKNGTNEEVDSVQVGVLYYNANELVNFTSQYVTKVGAGYTQSETVYIPTDADGNAIKFDRHEVVITAFDNE